MRRWSEFLEAYPHYGPLERAVREALAASNAPPTVKSFDLIAHEMAVLEALELLASGDLARFVDYRLAPTLDPAVQPLSVQTVSPYLPDAQSHLDLLRFALLVHDLGKGRGLPEPHAESTADLVAQLAIPHPQARVIQWLVRHHDLLGNIYSGERDPVALFRAYGELDGTSTDAAYRLLRIVTLCDLWGTQGAAYLTANKVALWNELASDEAVLMRSEDLFAWRLRRWSGDLVGGDRPNRHIELTRCLAHSGEMRRVAQAFGPRIGRVVYGFYLLLDLAAEELARLLVQVARQAEERSVPTLLLRFGRVYKPWLPDAAETLAEYRRQIADGQLSDVAIIPTQGGCPGGPDRA